MPYHSARSQNNPYEKGMDEGKRSEGLENIPSGLGGMFYYQNLSLPEIIGCYLVNPMFTSIKSGSLGLAATLFTNAS